MIFGGIAGGNSPIMYTMMESGVAVFKVSTNIFSSVTGLCSDEGKGLCIYIIMYGWIPQNCFA